MIKNLIITLKKTYNHLSDQSDRRKVIDVSNARKEYSEEENISALVKALREAGSGNLNQKAYPVNSIEYMKSFGITSI